MKNVDDTGKQKERERLVDWKDKAMGEGSRDVLAGLGHRRKCEVIRSLPGPGPGGAVSQLQERRA